jgi:hypothetical protein
LKIFIFILPTISLYSIVVAFYSNAHRALRLVYYDKTGASPKTCTAPEYNPSAIPSDVRNALHCTGNSYTNGNDDGWWQFVWNEAGKCVSEKTGMDTGKYYTLQNDAFKKYDVDAALKKANYDVTKMTAVDPKKVLDILQKAFGYRGFYTCDNETKANWSTVSICLSPLPPYNITKCPANLIKPNTKCKSGNLKINTEHGGPVSFIKFNENER